MGSGSFGGGGGGSGWSGGGTPSIALPMISFSGRRARPAAGGGGSIAGETVQKGLQKLAKFSRSFATLLFCSPLTAAVYRNLFRLSVVVFQNRDWKLIEKDYGVASDPGCLMRWANVIVNRAALEEPDKRVRELVHTCLEDFLVRALGDDITTYVTGDANAVLAKLDAKIFASTSGHFLGRLLWAVVEKELEKPPSGLEREMRGVTQNVADRIIEAFKRTFLHKHGVTYSDLFKVLCANQDWLFDQIRK